MTSRIPPGKRLILFDGDCNVCDAAVLYVIDHDPQALFCFAALQSDIGESLLAEHGLDSANFDSMVLVDGDALHTHSSAVLRTAWRLSGLPRIAAIFLLVPKILRDPMYKLFAAHRHRLVKRKKHCRLPDSELQQRFLA